MTVLLSERLKAASLKALSIQGLFVSLHVFPFGIEIRVMDRDRRHRYVCGWDEISEPHTSVLEEQIERGVKLMLGTESQSQLFEEGMKYLLSKQAAMTNYRMMARCTNCGLVQDEPVSGVDGAICTECGELLRVIAIGETPDPREGVDDASLQDSPTSPPAVV